jgi:hypothetical protein
MIVASSDPGQEGPNGPSQVKPRARGRARIRGSAFAVTCFVCMTTMLPLRAALADAVSTIGRT